MKGAPRLSKKAYERRLPEVRDALLDAQTELRHKKSFALAIIVTGLPTAGRSEIVNQFFEWLDPKHISVHALQKHALQKHALQKHPGAARTKPPMWRYWNALPARGEIAIYFLGWYEDYWQLALLKPKKARQREARVVERIRHLEAMLPRDKVRILKLHLHVDKKTQRQRIHELRASKMTRWRVTREDRWLAEHYDLVDKTVRRCIRQTTTKRAPWHIIDGADPEYRTLEAGSLLLAELQAGLKAPPVAAARLRWPEPVEAGSAKFPSHQSGKPLEDEEYEVELERLQGRFALLTRKSKFAKHGGVLVFEGMDAAGKGGVIRRLTAALDARQYCVVPVSAPTPQELSYPYLWRFWRRIPEPGEIAIFDRSWYGRVLVERVRDLTADADWHRAYAEIRELELQLSEHGLIVHKFWLAVSKEEQLKRFKVRDDDPLKRFKVDPEDWANRRFYDAYQIAAREMIERTNAEHAPWTVVEADDKKYARLKVLRAVCDSIERELD